MGSDDGSKMRKFIVYVVHLNYYWNKSKKTKKCIMNGQGRMAKRNITLGTNMCKHCKSLYLYSNINNNSSKLLLLNL